MTVRKMKVKISLKTKITFWWKIITRPKARKSLIDLWKLCWKIAKDTRDYNGLVMNGEPWTVTPKSDVKNNKIYADSKERDE